MQVRGLYICLYAKCASQRVLRPTKLYVLNMLISYIRLITRKYGILSQILLLHAAKLCMVRNLLTYRNDHVILYTIFNISQYLTLISEVVVSHIVCIANSNRMHTKSLFTSKYMKHKYYWANIITYASMIIIGRYIDKLLTKEVILSTYKLNLVYFDLEC